MVEKYIANTKEMMYNTNDNGIWSIKRTINAEVLWLIWNNDGVSLNNRDWVVITADFVVEYNKLYRAKGPVLKVKEIEKSEKPEQEVATFYWWYVEVIFWKS